MVTVLVWRPRAWRRTSAVESVLRQPRGRARSTKSRGLAADRMRSGTSAVRTLWDVCCEALWVSGLRRARWGARCLAAFSFVCA